MDNFQIIQKNLGLFRDLGPGSWDCSLCAEKNKKKQKTKKTALVVPALLGAIPTIVGDQFRHILYFSISLSITILIKLRG